MLLCQNYYIYELSADEHPLDVTSKIFSLSFYFELGRI